MYKVKFKNLFLIVLLVYPALINSMSGRQRLEQERAAARQRALAAQARQPAAAAAAGRGAPGGPVNQSIACQVCHEDFEEDDIHTIACGHRFCKPCLDGQLNSACLLNDDKQLRGMIENNLRCPNHSCRRQLSEDDLGGMAGFAGRANDLKNMLKAEHEARRNAHRHAAGSSLKDKAYICLFTQQCSNCKKNIEKISGCNHIGCPCGHHFCWACGNDWFDNRGALTHVNNYHCGSRINQLLGIIIGGKVLYDQYK